MKLALCSILLAFFICSLPGYCGTFLVTNGGFENGLTGWTVDNRYPGSPATLFSSPLNGYPMADVYAGTYSVGWYRTDGAFNDACPGGEGPGAGSVSQSWTVTPGTYPIRVSGAIFVHNDRVGQVEDYFGAGAHIKIYVDGQTDPVWQHDFWAGEGNSFWRYYPEIRNQIGSQNNSITTTTGQIKMSLVWRTKWDADMDLTAFDNVQLELLTPGSPIPPGSDVFTPKPPPTWSGPLPDWAPTSRTYHWPALGPTSGGPQFHHAKEFKVGLNPVCAAAADLNNDGWKDLVVCNEWSHTISVLLGNGKDGFQPAVDYPAGLNPRSVQIAQMMGTSAPEIIVAARGPSAFLVFPANGDGTFGTPISVATDWTPWSLVVADFNKDARCDVAVAELKVDKFSVYLGNGYGGFTKVGSYSTGDMPGFITAGDFDQNSIADILVNTFFDGKSELWGGSGSGTFNQYNVLDVGWQTMSSTVNDFNADGRPDFFSASSWDCSGAMYLNYGSFWFERFKWNGENLALPRHPTSVTSFSYGGSLPDIASANLATSDSTTYRASSSNPATYQFLYNFGSGDSLRHILNEDLNNDGYPDLVVCGGQSQTIGVLYGGPNRTFEAPITIDLKAWFPSNRGIALADFNKDGKLDIALGSADTHLNIGQQLFILKNLGSLKFEQSYSRETQADILSIATADFNGDTHIDIAAIDKDKVRIYTNNGSGAFDSMSIYTMGTTGATSLSDVAVGDFNNDGKPDIAAVDSYSGYEAVAVRLNQGTSFGSTLRTSIDRSGPKDLAVGDFNGDGKLDVVVAVQGTNQFVYMSGKGDGTFNAPVAYSCGAGPTGIDVADLNGDSKLDVVVSNRSSSWTLPSITIWFGVGNGTFTNRTFYKVGPEPTDVLARDFDMDGKVDLATANRGDFTISVLKGNGDGSFQSAYTYRCAGRPERLAAGDLRGIGLPDLCSSLGFNIKPEIWPNALLSTGTITVSDDGQIQTYTDRISGQWVATTTGGRTIVRYRWAVSTTPDPSGIIPGGEWKYLTAQSATRSVSLTPGVTYYILAQAQDSANLWTKIGASDGILVFQGQPVGIANAKTVSDGTALALSASVVTASFYGDGPQRIGFAVESPDRSCGIRVVSNQVVNPGDNVSVIGIAATVSGERVINAITVTVNSTGNPVPAAFSIANIDTGGGAFGQQGAVVNDAGASKMCTGTNNVGVLMTIRGKVRAVNNTGNYAGYFYVDDAYGTGSYETGLKDGSGNIGIKCRPAPQGSGAPGPLPTVGQYVEVTGVMGVQQISGVNARYFWTKSWTPATTTGVNKSYLAKWNLLSLRNQPVNPDPAVVFGGEDVIDGRLYAWDGPTQGLLLYDMWSPDAFGALSSSVGYWLNAAKAGNISYTGYVDSTPLDRWISAPKGWKIIGMPFSSNTAWANWKVTDGTSMKSLYDASQYGAGWLESVGYWWDAQNQGLKDFGLPDDFPSTEGLQPWHGYWVKLKKNVGLIGPAP